MQGLYFEDLSVGQSAETTKIVGAADVEAFAAVSGDTNPVHLNEDYARTTPFQTRIAHGMLSAPTSRRCWGPSCRARAPST